MDPPSERGARFANLRMSVSEDDVARDDLHLVTTSFDAPNPV